MSKRDMDEEHESLRRQLAAARIDMTQSVAESWRCCPFCGGRKSHREGRGGLSYRVCNKCGGRTQGWPSPALADREWQGHKPTPQDQTHVRRGK